MATTKALNCPVLPDAIARIYFIVPFKLTAHSGNGVQDLITERLPLLGMSDFIICLAAMDEQFCLTLPTYFPSTERIGKIRLCGW